MKLRAICFPILLGLVSLTAQFGCESAPSTGDGTSTFDYYVVGTVIQDPNIDSSRVVVKLLRDNKDYESADLIFGTDNLVFSNLKYGFDSIYTFSLSNTPGYAAGARILSLNDDPFFNSTVNVTVPDSFTIINVVPGNHLLNGPQTASIEWSGSANAQGYVIAGVLADSVYREYGYSEWIDVSFNSGTFPIETFSQSPSPDPDTGLYYLYVYAVAGIPDSALTSKLLPVPLPLQFPDNISTRDLTGRFGAIEVIRWDSVRVQTIP